MSENEKKKTLTDDDITSARADGEEKSVGRRSVLGVLGSLAAGGAAGTLGDNDGSADFPGLAFCASTAPERWSI